MDINKCFQSQSWQAGTLLIYVNLKRVKRSLDCQVKVARFRHVYLFMVKESLTIKQVTSKPIPMPAWKLNQSVEQIMNIRHAGYGSIGDESLGSQQDI